MCVAGRGSSFSLSLSSPAFAIYVFGLGAVVSTSGDASDMEKDEAGRDRSAGVSVCRPGLSAGGGGMRP